MKSLLPLRRASPPSSPSPLSSTGASSSAQHQQEQPRRPATTRTTRAPAGGGIGGAATVTTSGDSSAPSLRTTRLLGAIAIAAGMVIVSFVRADAPPSGGRQTDRYDGGGGLRAPRLRTTTDSDPDPKVQWTTFEDAPDTADFSSASWIMAVEAFMEVDTGPGSFRAFGDGGFSPFEGHEERLRRSLDYLDLSVERVSQWGRMVGAPHSDAGYQFAVQRLAVYVARHVAVPPPSPAPNFRGLSSAVAVVAFSRAPLDGHENAPHLSRAPDLAQRVHVFSVAALAATLASLIHVGVGRVVVVGSDPDDDPVVRQTFQQLIRGAAEAEAEATVQHWFELPVSPDPRDGGADERVVRVRETDLTFVVAPSDLASSAFEKNHGPRGALAGLQLAFQHTDANWTTAWLGPDADSYQYVYYSEADTLLQTRPSVLKHLVNELDDGHILAPHRLQLLAYEGDVPDYREHSHNGNDGLVPANVTTPVTVNSGEVVVLANEDEEGGPTSADGRDSAFPRYQHCCDALEGSYRPGRDDHPPCGDVWYRCMWMVGEGIDGNPTRPEPYRLMRLSTGTGIATLAATEHGRRCHPSAVPCRRRRAANETAAAG